MNLQLLLLLTTICAYFSLAKELNCDKLKDCLTKVTKDSTCKCAAEEEKSLKTFNTCMIGRGFSERCAEQNTKEICFSWATCDQQGSRCYDQFHDEYNRTEEVMFEVCMGELNQT